LIYLKLWAFSLKISSLLLISNIATKNAKKIAVLLQRHLLLQIFKKMKENRQIISKVLLKDARKIAVIVGFSDNIMCAYMA
jgi:hypothetical protein